MDNNIKEVLHLYLGCEVMAPNPYDEKELAKGYLTGIHGEYGPEVQFIIDGNSEESPEYPNYENVKLCCRRLSSMSEEEAREAIKLNLGISDEVVVLEKIDQGKEMIYRYGFIYQTPPDTETSVYVPTIRCTSYEFAYLLSKGFWLFSPDAFDKGLIIDRDALPDPGK